MTEMKKSLFSLRVWEVHCTVQRTKEKGNLRDFHIFCTQRLGVFSLYLKEIQTVFISRICINSLNAWKLAWVWEVAHTLKERNEFSGAEWGWCMCFWLSWFGWKFIFIMFSIVEYASLERTEPQHKRRVIYLAILTGGSSLTIYGI